MIEDVFAKLNLLAFFTDKHWRVLYNLLCQQISKNSFIDYIRIAVSSIPFRAVIDNSGTRHAERAHRHKTSHTLKPASPFQSE